MYKVVKWFWQKENMAPKISNLDINVNKDWRSLLYVRWANCEENHTEVNHSQSAKNER
jgi:hypothetical protein